MKKIILTEAPRTPLEKMHDANIGNRRQNWSACNDRKLEMYYKICLKNNFVIAKNECEAELKKRDLWIWLAPRPWNIDNFTASNAQYLWDERKTCHRIIQTACDLPSRTGDVLRPSEYLLRAFVLATCMGHEEDLKMLIKWIKEHMKIQPYYHLVPQYLDELMARTNVPEDTAKAIKMVNYN